MRAAIPWVIAAAGVYLADLALRCLKTRLCTARLAPLPELGATAVEVPALEGGWRAGQHVRLRVLSRRMGWLSWAETHPFTIASASGAIAQRGLVLLCKNTGRWTRRLQALAGKEQMDGSGMTMTVMVEGPYGECPIVVCGGIANLLCRRSGGHAVGELLRSPAGPRRERDLVRARCSGGARAKGHGGGEHRHRPRLSVVCPLLW